MTLALRYFFCMLQSQFQNLKRHCFSDMHSEKGNFCIDIINFESLSSISIVGNLKCEDQCLIPYNKAWEGMTTTGYERGIKLILHKMAINTWSWDSQHKTHITKIAVLTAMICSTLTEEIVDFSGEWTVLTSIYTLDCYTLTKL